jgi:hypothetical protein
MGKEYILSYRTACQWWRRSDLGNKPKNMEQVAEVLRQAGIDVYSDTFATDGWLVCEPRPFEIYEVLSGQSTADSGYLSDSMDITTLSNMPAQKHSPNVEFSTIYAVNPAQLQPNQTDEN